MEDYKHKEQDAWNFTFTLLFLILVFFFSRYLAVNKHFPSGVPAMDFFIMIMATFRLITLFMYDSVTSYIREFFENFEIGPGRTVANLLSCPWCTGVWMALVVTLIYFLVPYSWLFLFILAVSGMASVIQIIVNRI